MKFEELRESMINCSFYVQKKMNELLPENFSASKIVEAMRYSAMSDGKRIRPFLVMAIANIFNFPPIKSLTNLIHRYYSSNFKLMSNDL